MPYKDPAQKRAHHSAYTLARYHADAAYRLRHSARRTLNHAVARGDIERMSCGCGSDQVQAHHSDYARPLDVRWLCRACHEAEHGGQFHRATVVKHSRKGCTCDRCERKRASNRRSDARRNGLEKN